MSREDHRRYNEALEKLRTEAKSAMETLSPQRKRREKQDRALTVLLAIAGFVLTLFLRVILAGVALFAGLFFLADWVGNLERMVGIKTAKIRKIQATIIILGIVLECIGLYPFWKKEQAASLSGVLIGSPGLPTDPIRFQWGNSGVTWEWKGPKDTPQFKDFPEGAKLFFHRGDNGELLVDTEVLDRNGNLVVEVKDNVWTVSSSQSDCWDKNYTKDALEVKDGRGRIALQIRFYPDRVSFSGEWWAKEGNGVRIAGTPMAAAAMVFMVPSYHPDEPHIEPLFVYPSRDHWGEFVVKQIPSNDNPKPSAPIETVVDNDSLPHRHVTLGQGNALNELARSIPKDAPVLFFISTPNDEASTFAKELALPFAREGRAFYPAIGRSWIPTTPKGIVITVKTQEDLAFPLAKKITTTMTNLGIPAVELMVRPDLKDNYISVTVGGNAQGQPVGAIPTTIELHPP